VFIGSPAPPYLAAAAAAAAAADAASAAAAFAAAFSLSASSKILASIPKGMAWQTMAQKHQAGGI